MIYLNTGLPGNGKTLYTLHAAWELAQKEGRTVYVNGIPDLKLPHQELTEPEKWYDCPDGAIIVIDECQRIFPPRASGKAVPEKVSQFETHRHKGFDVFLITQHPNLIDNHVRRLVGEHNHVVRQFGLPYATLFRWTACTDNPQGAAAKKDAISHRFNYPKKLYEQYRSATLHTHKAKLPWKVIAMLVAAACMAGWGIYSFMTGTLMGSEKAKPGQGTGGAPGHVQAKVLSPKEALLAKLAEGTPRLDGVPWSAPRYDQLTQKAVYVPVPTSCIQIVIDGKDNCTCYFEKVKLAVGQDVCHSFVRDGGLFVDFEVPRHKNDDTGSAKASSPIVPTQAPVASPSPVPVAS